MLWVDKYRPLALDKLDYHRELTEQLQRLARAGDLPHMLFYGPSGAGKKTRIMALLRAIFGAGAERLKLEHRAFKLPSGKVLEISTVASTYHIEINPGDAGIYDRYVVQELIKEMAQYNAVSAGEASRSWKVLVLSEVDRLTKEAQAALRRTMERYTATCRLILVANNLSKVIDPVRSRCLGIRVAAPSQAEVMAVLTSVASKEGLSLPIPLAARISNVANRNMRRALLMLEALRAQTGGAGLTAASLVPLMDWERFIVMLASDLLREQSPKQLLLCRSRVYELLVNCVPADIVIKRLAAQLMTTEVLPVPRHLTETFKHEVAAWAAHYEHRLQLGTKELFHIEAFIARIMHVIKTAAASPALPAGVASAAPGVMVAVPATLPAVAGAGAGR